MAVSTVTNRVAYQADGTSATFAFQYPLHSQSHLAAFIYNSSVVVGPIITPLVLNTDYTLSGQANSQGIYPTGLNLIMNSTPNAQAVMVIFRSSVVTNGFSVGQNGTIPSTALNQELDYLTLISQRLQDQASLSVRVPDGYFGTFDPTLPANLAQSANKRLIVNSTVTGWTFDETAASYIPNSVIVAATNSSITSLGGAATGQFLQSQGSSAPQWAAIGLGTGSVLSGALPVANGGTGLTSLTQYGILYASSATAVSVVPSATSGWLLQSNGSSAPSFAAFAASNINSGTFAVAIGGTGANSFSASQLLFASSATRVDALPGSAALRYLISNGSSAPTWSLISASSIQSIGAANGLVLTADGGNGTSWQAAPGSPGLNQIRLQGPAAVAVGTTNDTIRCFGGSIQIAGSSMTYTSSATNGDSITINATGLYAFSYSDAYGNNGVYDSTSIGLTLNATNLRGPNGKITLMSSATVVLAIAGASNFVGCASGTWYLTNGDVVRPHTSGSSVVFSVNSTAVRLTAVRIL